jgi:hypothetical protein
VILILSHVSAGLGLNVLKFTVKAVKPVWASHILSVNSMLIIDSW